MVPGTAVAVLAVEGGDAHPCLGDAARLDERTQPDRGHRVRGEAASHHQVVAGAELGVRHAHEGHVVDLGIRALHGAPTDRGLVLARQVGERRVTEHPFRDGADVERAIEELVGGHAGERAPHDDPRGVAARFLGGQPDGFEPFPDGGDVLDPDPVQLHVLAVGDVGDVAPEPLRCPRDRAELLAAQPSAVHPDPHHEELVLELLRLGAPRALTGNALFPLRVEAPPTQPRPQVLLADRPESARSEDPLDAFANGEPVVLLLDLLRGVERLVVAQPPLTLAARARGADGPVGGFVHGFRVVDRGRERRGPPVRAAGGAAGGSCGLPHAMARARGARAVRTAAETGRDHGGDLSDGSCADHGSLSGRPFASGSPRSAPAAHGGSLVAGAKPYLSGRKDVKERGHRCACVPPRSAPGAGGGRRRGR